MVSEAVHGTLPCPLVISLPTREPLWNHCRRIRESCKPWYLSRGIISRPDPAVFARLKQRDPRRLQARSCSSDRHSSLEHKCSATNTEPWAVCYPPVNAVNTFLSKDFTGLHGLR